MFIILTRHEPSRFADQPRVVAARSYLQTTLVLPEMGKIPPDAISTVARDLRRNRISEDIIAKHLADAEHRLGIARESTLLAGQ